MNDCPIPEELELYAMHIVEGSVRQYQYIDQHVKHCPECREALKQMEDAQQLLHENLDLDPGEAFTQAIMRRAKRPWRDRIWNLRWMPFGRALSWGLACIAFITICIVRFTQPKIGNDRVTVTMPPKVLAGAPCAVPVYVTDPQGKPIANGRVSVSGDGIEPFSGQTDHAGFCQASFKVPVADKQSILRLQVDVTTGSGQHQLQMPVQIETATALHLSTDKPLYRPGQKIHMRLLCLNRVAMTPSTGQEVTLTVADPRHNLLFIRTAKSDERGIATADFPLDTQASSGNYTIEAKCGENTATRIITVPL